MSAIINTSKELLEKMNSNNLFAEIVYGRYYREFTKEQEEIDAADVVLPRDRCWGHKSRANAIKIQDGMFIVELHNYDPSYDVVYTSVVDGKKCYEVFLEFDKALLCAIAMRHGAEISGVKYAGMILGI